MIAIWCAASASAPNSPIIAAEATNTPISSACNPPIGKPSARMRRMSASDPANRKRSRCAASPRGRTITAAARPSSISQLTIAEAYPEPATPSAGAPR